MKTVSTKSVILVILLVIAASNHLQSQTNFVWGKQFGSDKDEYALNHLTDQNGNIYVAGKTTGTIDGKNLGENDGFLIKIDNQGNTLWSRQFGTSQEEDIQWSAIDNEGNVYITGSTTGVLQDKNFGKEDVFVIKYTPQGEVEWSRQFGTDSIDVAKGIYADPSGFVYITGFTGGTMGKSSMGKTDGFIMKLDSKGNQLFTYQYGTPLDDYSYAVTGDGNSAIYVCGSTWGDIAEKNKGFIDAFVGQFTDKGSPVKYTQFGSEGFDIAMNLLVDGEKNIYVGGTTSGNYGCEQIGEGDCFLVKIGKKGSIEWIKQFGTKNNDGIRSIELNPNVSDNILVSGVLNLPPAHAFVRMYTKEGSLLWEKNFVAESKNGDTSGKDVSMDNNGNIYHLGLTGANVFGTLIGGHDVYLVKFELDKSFMNH